MKGENPITLVYDRLHTLTIQISPLQVYSPLQNFNLKMWKFKTF